MKSWNYMIGLLLAAAGIAALRLFDLNKLVGIGLLLASLFFMRFEFRELDNPDRGIRFRSRRIALILVTVIFLAVTVAALVSSMFVAE